MDQELTDLARRFLLRIVPQAAAELRRLKQRAKLIPDAELRREALSSITHKDFHVHGGCILATFLPPAQAKRYVALIAAFETAVDYLDNLCDRVGTFDEADFRALHEALNDAIIPGAPLRDYFRHRAVDDGGYLAALVKRSQEHFAALPSYDIVAPLVRGVTDRYCELQALKHLAPGVREQRCKDAFATLAFDLQWWEGAAACGSTMPTFALAFGAVQGCELARAEQLLDAYFPYISAFHILLDYFIDQAEDSVHGELNFVGCYPSRKDARDGIARVGRAALARARSTDDPRRHDFAVRAMCTFYCSRKKVAEQSLGEDARAIAAAVDVELGSADWRANRAGMLAPLLALYRHVIRV
ncbi:MAG: tetraprenyl-beta-curcumene synthase family protein [Candidatus Eremiobacteraeota bacterium]|nr:tetraprenyl-beta-curcumene synthase family protein [Candidatus Eremiobacteraeota bacterium]